jgi:hypothetical protein
VKIKAYVTKCELDGDGHIKLALNGWEENAAEGTIALPITVTVRNTEANRRAYHLWRDVTILMEPKR